MLNNNLEEIKNKQTEMNKNWNENTLEEIKSEINEAKEQISELEDRVEITATEQQQQQQKKNEKKWGPFKRPLGQY